MIHFPILRTKRITVQLNELKIGDALRIAVIPEQTREIATTEFLKAVVDGDANPRNWTVQDRVMAVAHYLAAISPDGPDFQVGDGHYSDYLDGGVDIQPELIGSELGIIDGDAWTIVHLTGAMAESVERLEGQVNGLSGRLHWLLGCMAAQLVRSGETIPVFDVEEQYDDWLKARMLVIANYPESSFQELMYAFRVGRDRLYHLFNIDFNDSGIVVAPKRGGDGGLPPAMFPVHAAISPTARAMVTRTD